MVWLTSLDSVLMKATFPCQANMLHIQPLFILQAYMCACWREWSTTVTWLPVRRLLFDTLSRVIHREARIMLHAGMNGSVEQTTTPNAWLAVASVQRL